MNNNDVKLLEFDRADWVRDAKCRGMAVSLLPEQGAAALCVICPTSTYALGFCRRHYRALKKWGDPRKRPPTLSERVLSNYSVNEHGCWVWIRQLNNDGYGLIWDGRVRQKVCAHRVSYELARGSIPSGLELDHLCRVRACINPDHLEPVIHAENIRRGYEHRRTS